MELSHGVDKLSHSNSSTVKLSKSQRDALELLYQECPRPSPDFLEDVLRDRPLLSALDTHYLKAWFHNRRLKEKRDEKLSPLIHKNAELKAEHQSLLLRNNQLRNQTLLLNIENQRLKQELEVQLQKNHLGSSSQPSCEFTESLVSDLERSLGKVKLTDVDLCETGDELSKEL